MQALLAFEISAPKPWQHAAPWCFALGHNQPRKRTPRLHCHQAHARLSRLSSNLLGAPHCLPQRAVRLPHPGRLALEVTLASSRTLTLRAGTGNAPGLPRPRHAPLILRAASHKGTPRLQACDVANGGTHAGWGALTGSSTGRGELSARIWQWSVLFDEAWGIEGVLSGSTARRSV
jgi:hypothetical protein